jgi:hypothetical protein
VKVYVVVSDGEAEYPAGLEIVTEGVDEAEMTC